MAVRSNQLGETDELAIGIEACVVDADTRSFDHVPDRVHAAIRPLSCGHFTHLLISARQPLKLAQWLSVTTQRDVVDTIQLA